RLLDPGISAAQKDAVEEDVRGRVTAYFDALPMGAPVIHSKLLAAVVGHENVADAIVKLGPAGSLAPSIEENVGTEGRKAHVARASIGVALMSEPVSIDVLVMLDSKSPQPTPDQHDAALHALDALSATGTRTLAKTDMVAALTAALRPLNLSTSNAVVANATYGDTGRQLLNPDTIELAEQHVVKWNSVSLQVEGV
ncbi:MAG: hypothetical protein ACRDMZ_02270, partial [Solirubrobacteraceae bacterium]